MNIKKLKIAILDENDNTLKSLNYTVRWTDELEEDMRRFHNIDAKDKVIDMLFDSIVEVANTMGLTEEQWKELKNE